MPKLNSAYLNAAMQKIVRYVQCEDFGKIMQGLSDSSSGNQEDVTNELATHTVNDSVRKHVADFIRSIRCLRSHMHPDKTLRIAGRLSQFELPTDEKFSIIVLFWHSFTHLLVLRCHQECAHGEIQYTLMLTPRQFWFIRGLSLIRHYTGRCNQ